MRTLARGQMSGLEGRTQEVIKDPAAWEKLWKKHTGTRGGESAPSVDFQKEMVLATGVGLKRTGGYSIAITTTAVTNQELRVTVQEKSPPPGAMVTQALTAPFHFVAVPRSDLKVVFLTESGGNPPAKNP